MIKLLASCSVVSSKRKGAFWTSSMNMKGYTPSTSRLLIQGAGPACLSFKTSDRLNSSLVIQETAKRGREDGRIRPPVAERYRDLARSPRELSRPSEYSSKTFETFRGLDDGELPSAHVTDMKRRARPRPPGCPSSSSSSHVPFESGVPLKIFQSTPPPPPPPTSPHG